MYSGRSPRRPVYRRSVKSGTAQTLGTNKLRTTFTSVASEAPEMAAALATYQSPASRPNPKSRVAVTNHFNAGSELLKSGVGALPSV